MPAIYNELDAFPAAWMRNLIAAGHIAPGVVDERSIKDLTAADVAGPGQRHFFAGIGVWSYALRLANVQDDANIWTGSCPCQPFSGAGKRGGFDDERHLWPVWFELIRECRPAVIFGEQVSSPDGLAWFDAVSADLEGAGYAVGALDIGAASVGAPHIRQRLYFVARRLGDSDHRDIQRHDRAQPGSQSSGRHSSNRHDAASPGPVNGFWSDSDWLACTDGKHRPVKPGARVLVDESPVRLGRLRAFGNAIVARQAASFIEAALGAIGGAA